eukprot:scaffold2261_cov405-Prasinococcus_capsulatus_cf.AAC.45
MVGKYCSLGVIKLELIRVHGLHNLKLVVLPLQPSGPRAIRHATRHVRSGQVNPSRSHSGRVPRTAEHVVSAADSFSSQSTGKVRHRTLSRPRASALDRLRQLGQPSWAATPAPADNRSAGRLPVKRKAAVARCAFYQCSLTPAPLI